MPAAKLESPPEPDSCEPSSTLTEATGARSCSNFAYENPIMFPPNSTEDVNHLKLRNGSTSSTIEIGNEILSRSSVDNDKDNNNMVEIQISPVTSKPSDPYGLKHRKKTDLELQECCKKNKKLDQFYKTQNELIDEILEPFDSNNEPQNTFQDTKTKIAVYGSAGANVCLMVVQLIAAIMSGSLSIYATLADAFMDVISSGVLLAMNYLGGRTEIYRYPSGKGRYETVGILVFGTLMCTLSLQLMITAGQNLIEKPSAPNIGLVSIIMICVAFATKLCLFLYCRTLKNNPSAKILALDHRNDLFVNATGLCLGILGSKVNSYIDPIGAIIVALIIFRSWAKAVLEHSKLIVGKSADPEFLTKITYIALTHDPQIVQVDTCRAYHSGSKLIVEVDIVLPGETTLQVAHDLGETLQIKLESLPNVERAYVHVDYESTHRPEHRKDK